MHSIVAQWLSDKCAPTFLTKIGTSNTCQLAVKILNKITQRNLVQCDKLGPCVKEGEALPWPWFMQGAGGTFTRVNFEKVEK